MKEERWNLQWHAKFQLSHAQKGKVDGHFASLVGMQICAASVEGKLVVVLMHLPLTQGFSFNLQMHVNMHCKIRVIARDWGALHFHGRPGASSRVHRTRKQEDTSLSSTRAGSVLGSGVGGRLLLLPSHQCNKELQVRGLHPTRWVLHFGLHGSPPQSGFLDAPSAAVPAPKSKQSRLSLTAVLWSWSSPCHSTSLAKAGSLSLLLCSLPCSV